MRLDTVFLDIDNTLLDFRKGALQSIRDGFEAFGLTYTDDVGEAFFRINNALWRQIEAGSLTRERLHEIRWNTIFADRGITADGPAFEAAFRRGINENAVPVDGARELLDFLKTGFRVFAASNADFAQQEYRLNKAGLLPYFDGLFVSDRIGAPKPSRAFFETCIRLANTPAERILMIGDSPAADIAGAAACGLATCLYAPDGFVPADGIRPDLTVSSLVEIKNCLSGGRFFV
ncbi:MAG: HAD-IA family hydrolase [Clostridia bacterium]|nr:HAD-IA family hydrolase [Clostridia bacterium]